jgi:hypothetical protein
MFMIEIPRSSNTSPHSPPRKTLVAKTEGQCVASAIEFDHQFYLQGLRCQAPRFIRSIQTTTDVMATAALNLDFLDLPSERDENQLQNEVLDVDRFVLPVASNVRYPPFHPKPLPLSMFVDLAPSLNPSRAAWLVPDRCLC